MYLHKATFVGNCQFPCDMLRYDQCFPESSQDAARIADSVRGNRDKLPDGTPAPITVCSYRTTSTWEWAEARWKSFGWVRVRSEIRIGPVKVK